MDTASTFTFRYVLSDIPPSMTIADYRRNRGRGQRKHSRLGRLLAAARGRA